MCWRAAPRAPSAEIENCIDEFIEFEFFHSVSGLGPKQISQEEYQALRDRLAPYRFDIAVDLRKHLDTRDVLRYTPARFLAGYDHLGQFPFLDISLEWEGDRYLQRKRSHVTRRPDQSGRRDRRQPVRRTARGSSLRRRRGAAGILAG